MKGDGQIYPPPYPCRECLIRANQSYLGFFEVFRSFSIRPGFFPGVSIGLEIEDYIRELRVIGQITLCLQKTLMDFPQVCERNHVNFLVYGFEVVVLFYPHRNHILAEVERGEQVSVASTLVCHSLFRVHILFSGYLDQNLCSVHEQSRSNPLGPCLHGIGGPSNLSCAV